MHIFNYDFLGPFYFYFQHTIRCEIIDIRLLFVLEFDLRWQPHLFKKIGVGCIKASNGH